MISQDQFNKLMETYETNNYSIIYDVALNLLRIINLLGIVYLISINL